MGFLKRLRNGLFDLVGFASPKTARRGWHIYRGKKQAGKMAKWAVLARINGQNVTRGQVKATTKSAAMKKARRLLRAANIDCDRITVKKFAR